MDVIFSNAPPRQPRKHKLPNATKQHCLENACKVFSAVEWGSQANRTHVSSVNLPAEDAAWDHLTR